MNNVVYHSKFFTPAVHHRLEAYKFQERLIEQNKLTWLRLLKDKLGELANDMTLLTSQLVEAEYCPEIHKRIAHYALALDALHDNIGTLVISQSPVTPIQHALNEVSNMDDAS